MYLGYEVQDGQNTGRVIGYPGDGHMLTVGPTRTGKTRRLLIPNLLYETGRSALVIDMKGELTEITAAHREANGGKVAALDPFGLLAKRGVKVQTAGFNPLWQLDPASDEFVDDAMVIAEALIQVNPEMKEPHFAEAAQDVVAALIMWAKWKRKERATLREVRAMICQPKEGLQVVAVAAAKENAHPAIIGKLAKFLKPAQDNRELDSILSTAQTQTRFLDSPGIIRNLSAGGGDFGTLKTENKTIYLVMPPKRLVTHAKWLRLIISAAMTAMQNTLKVHGRPDVLFMLDEFPQLGRLEVVETAVSLNAGYGVKVWAAIQHFGQLKDQYGDNWETFLSAGCVTTFAPRDVFTRDHLTQLIGTGSKAMRSVSYNTQDGHASYTDSVQKDDLMPAQKWRSMILGEQYAIIPTEKGTVIKNIYGPDFTELPEVKSGTIRPGAI